ncbi:BspA family leucine-rich repeat surface protein [Vibrio harveyi]|nr:BspA family leucine-rich repeat surface protein [Vibrio harveyi]
MFYEALEFDQEINHFNTSKVKTMESMFYKAHKFNKPLDN